MGSDAGCSGIKTALSIVIQNRQTSHPSRCLMYGTHCDNVVCDLISGANFAIQQGNQMPFVHRQMEMPNVSLQMIELNSRCFGKPIARGLDLFAGMKT